MVEMCMRTFLEWRFNSDLRITFFPRRGLCVCACVCWGMFCEQTVILWARWPSRVWIAQDFGNYSRFCRYQIRRIFPLFQIQFVYVKLWTSILLIHLLFCSPGDRCCLSLYVQVCMIKQKKKCQRQIRHQLLLFLYALTAVVKTSGSL